MIYKKIIFSVCIMFSFCSFLNSARQDNVSINDALFSAVKDNKKDTVSALLAQGADPNARNAFGQTAMGYAVMTDKTDIAELLLEHGGKADSEATISTFDMGMKVQRQYPLLLLAVQKKNIEMVKLLLNHEADVNVQGHKGATGLTIAVNLGRTDMVELLLSKGADVNARMEDGKTALIWAILRKNSDMVSMLLAHDADASITDKRGNNALQYAQKIGDKDIIKRIEEAPVKRISKKNHQNAVEKNSIGKTIISKRIILYNIIIFAIIIAGAVFFYIKK